MLRPLCGGGTYVWSAVALSISRLRCAVTRAGSHRSQPIKQQILWRGPFSGGRQTESQWDPSARKRGRAVTTLKGGFYLLITIRTVIFFQYFNDHWAPLMGPRYKSVHQLFITFNFCLFDIQTVNDSAKRNCTEMTKAIVIDKYTQRKTVNLPKQNYTTQDQQK